MKKGIPGVYLAAVSFALPAAVMAAFVSGWYILLFSALAAASSLLLLYRLRTAATIVCLSALLLFIGVRSAGLQTDAIGAFLILFIAFIGSSPERGDADERGTDKHGGMEPFLFAQLTGLFLLSFAVVVASEILSSQIGFRINSLVLIIPVVGAAMLMIIFAAEGIRGGKG